MTKTLRDEINELKKASLIFDVVPMEIDNTPRLDTYFGGKPFVTEEIEIHECPICDKSMQFVCQLLMPNRKNNTKKLYAFYYCFGCLEENIEGTYAVNIYANPSEENMLTEFEYTSEIPYADVRFLPAYDIPDWEYCLDSNPQFARKLETLYGDKAEQTYLQLQKKVEEYAVDTGNKLKGFPRYLDYHDIPKCPRSGQPMEPLIQMECMPQLNMNWLGSHSSYLVLFKSPTYDEFELRTIDFGDLEEPDMFEDTDEEDIFDF